MKNHWSWTKVESAFGKNRFKELSKNKNEIYDKEQFIISELSRRIKELNDFANRKVGKEGNMQNLFIPEQIKNQLKNNKNRIISKNHFKLLYLLQNIIPFYLELALHTSLGDADEQDKKDELSFIIQQIIELYEDGKFEIKSKNKMKAPEIVFELKELKSQIERMENNICKESLQELIQDNEVGEIGLKVYHLRKTIKNGLFIDTWLSQNHFFNYDGLRVEPNIPQNMCLTNFVLLDFLDVGSNNNFKVKNVVNSRIGDEIPDHLDPHVNELYELCSNLIEKLNQAESLGINIKEKVFKKLAYIAWSYNKAIRLFEDQFSDPTLFNEIIEKDKSINPDDCF